MNDKFIILIVAILLGSCTSHLDEFENEVQPPCILSEAVEMNIWIYQQMKHYYLWNEDIPDSLDCNFSLTPTEFYDRILSSKDRFSYIKSNTVKTGDVGFAYQAFKRQNGEVVYQVLYVNSIQAKQSGLKRGDFVKLKSHIGNRIALERLTIGNEFDEIEEITYEVDTQSNTNSTVLLDSIYNIENKRIGYLCYLEYGEPEDFFEAFKLFKSNNIDELILDLRYNPGGYVNTCRKLCSLIAPSLAYGNVFQQNSYNNIIAQENLRLYGNERTFTYFEKPINNSEPIIGLRYNFLDLENIYILTSSHTASASESTIYCLKPYMNVTTIGNTTVGKGVGMQSISSNKYRYSLVPITFRYYNSDGETVPDTGIVPDYIVEDSYFMPKSEIGDITEPLLSKALDLIIPSRCNLHSIGSFTKIGNTLIPIGEPSYVTEFNNKHYNESN